LAIADCRLEDCGLPTGDWRNLTIGNPRIGNP
jgi:hypothetical protein